MAVICSWRNVKSHFLRRAVWAVITLRYESIASYRLPGPLTRLTKAAIAAPISLGLSSCNNLRPLTVISGLIRPAADGLAQAAAGERAWLTIDEQFRNIALPQPSSVLAHDLRDVCGLAFNRKAAGP